MKDRVLNGLMLAAVAGALAVSWLRGPRRDAPGDVQAAFRAAPTAAPAETPSPEQAYRARRQETRRREQTALQALLNSEYAAEETRDMAADLLAAMARSDETELAVEAALCARGCPEALCVARQGEVTVLLSRSLTEREAGLILEIARTASGLPLENIRVTGF